MCKQCEVLTAELAVAKVELSNMRHRAGSCECAARMLEEANEALIRKNAELTKRLDPEETHL